MANGSFKTGWGQYTKTYDLIVEWRSTADIAANSSTITATIKFYCPYSCNMGKRYNNKVVINGVSYDFTSPEINTSGGTTHTLATITSNPVAHNADGTRSVSISATFRFNASLSGTYYGEQTASKTVALDNIPRAATLTAAPNFNDEENPIITYNNAAGSAVTALRACISFDGSNDDIQFRDVPKTGSTYTFTLTDAERNLIRNRMSNTNSMGVVFSLATIIGGVWHYSKLYRTVSIVNGNPIVNPTAYDTDASIVALTGNNKVTMLHYTDLFYNLNAQAQKGASIVSYKIHDKLNTKTTGSGTFTDVNNGLLFYTVTDSRGNKTEGNVGNPTFTYKELTCNIQGELNTAGDLDISISGDLFTQWFGSKVDTANSLTVEYRYKTSGSEYGEWIPIYNLIIDTPNTDYRYQTQAQISGLGYKNSYVIQARATDRVKSVYSTEETILSYPIYDWSANDFNFNVPVHFSQGISGNNGTWKPTLNASAISSYTNQDGWYQKCGNVVSLGFYVKATCKAGYESTGISISGLPFVPAIAAAGGGLCSGTYVSSGFTFQSWVAGTNSTITARVQQVNHTTATNLATSASGCFYRSSGGEITLSGTITYITT